MQLVRIFINFSFIIIIQFVQAVCPASTNNIMTAIIGVYGNLKNTIYFSNCTMNSWKNLLLIKNTILNPTCSNLLNIPSKQPIQATYFSNYLPGQMWSMDQQCQYAMGWIGSSANACVVCVLFLIFGKITEIFEIIG